MRTMLAVTALVAVSAGELLHKAAVVPEGWQVVEGVQAPRDMLFPVTVGMKRSNKAKLAKLAEEVSNPQRAEYRQFLSYTEVAELVRPAAKDAQLVRNWLTENGVTITREHPHGDYIHGEATVQALEKMVQGKFQKYVHKETGSSVYRVTSGVKVPAAVARVVDTVIGFEGFPLKPAEKKEKKLQAAGYVTPVTFRETYGVQYVRKSGKQNIQAIAQFQGEYVDDDNLRDFCKQYNNGDSCVISKYIGRNPQRPGVESMLDTEYIMGITNASTTWVYSYPSVNFCNDLAQFGSEVTSETQFPYVISISYGSQKIDFCESGVVNRFAEDIQKMATMGISVLIASGDDGSGYVTRQGNNVDHKLSPSFPASIPYATAVGSTYFVQGHGGQQEATRQFGSGGGFSYDFTAPSYQESDVNGYLNSVDLPQAPYQYAKGGRGTPDVAALGEDFTVLSGGRTFAVGGTSASTPSMAAIVTLLNEACLAKSGKSLGFLNPLFYQNPQVFTDIVVGTNAIGENRAAGWKCVKGWDAATGLGVPQFKAMLNLVQSKC